MEGWVGVGGAPITQRFKEPELQIKSGWDHFSFASDLMRCLFPKLEALCAHRVFLETCHVVARLPVWNQTACCKFTMGFNNQIKIQCFLWPQFSSVRWKHSLLSGLLWTLNKPIWLMDINTRDAEGPQQTHFSLLTFSFSKGSPALVSLLHV